MSPFKKITINLFAFLFIFQGLPIGYSESNINTLSLKDALHIAYFQNPEMREAREWINASKGKKVTESAFLGPSAKIKNSGSYEITQPFHPPGVRFLKSKIAKNNIKIAEGDLTATWAGVYQEVKVSYVTLLFTEEAMKVFESNLKAARQFLDSVELQYQSGKVLKSESIRAKIEVLKSEEELLEIQNENQMAKTHLNLLLGRPIHTELYLKGSLNYEPREMEHDESFSEKAVQDRPEVKNQQLRVDSAKKDFWRSKLAFLPEPFVGLDRSNEEYDRSYGFFFGGRIPLWDFNWGEMREKKAIKKREEIHLHDLEMKVTDEVHEAGLAVELATKKIDIQKKAMEEVNELLKQAHLQFEEGRLSFLGYLENLKVSKEVRLSYYAALKGYHEKWTDFEKATHNIPIPEGE